jgi:Methyltransferase domain
MSAKGKLRDAKRQLSTLVTVIRSPLQAVPGHYYSPLTTREDGQRAARWAAPGLDPIGLEIDKDGWTALAGELAAQWLDVELGPRYRPCAMFGVADAAIYSALLRKFKPKRVLEVGSGYSTAVALDAISRHELGTAVDCIEPHPERLQSLLGPTDSFTLHQVGVQDAPAELFSGLAAGDFLFVDSTHVVKSGSDVVWNTLRLLPSLPAGVFVHIHDIFWPMEYPESWLLGRRDWNEIYLIHAFLAGNRDWEIVLFNDWVWQNCVDLVGQHLPKAAGERPGGLWLRKIS